jgi:hypothetical protein
VGVFHVLRADANTALIAFRPHEPENRRWRRGAPHAFPNNFRLARGLARAMANHPSPRRQWLERRSCQWR